MFRKTPLALFMILFMQKCSHMKRFHDWIQLTLSSAIKQNEKVWLFLMLSQLILEFLLNYVTTQAQEIGLKYPQKCIIYLDTNLKNYLFLHRWIRSNQIHFHQWKKGVQIALPSRKLILIMACLKYLPWTVTESGMF